jgi:predicted dienelactone hydrolase
VKICFRTKIAALLFLCVVGLSMENMASAIDSATVKYQDWSDKARNRTIPVKLYLPNEVKSPLPVVIFSHGLGGSREAASYLGDSLAKNGYIGVFIQHPGSDESFWKDSLKGTNTDKAAVFAKFKEVLANPIHAVNRANDVHFVLDQLAKINATDPELKGKLNLNEVAIAGHSYGAWTALTASGQRTALGRSNADTRIKAAIYLSPTPPKKGQDPKQVFGAIAIPGLHVTGTRDFSPVNNTAASDRRIAYDNISKGDQYLLVLEGAEHAAFGGQNKFRHNPDDEKYREVTARVSTEFLNAYLKHDAKAKQWLTQTAPSYLRPFGTYETKTRK